MNQTKKKNILLVDNESDGMRVDNFLIKSLKGLPKSKIYSMIRKGEIRINSKRVKPLSRIKIDDRIRIPPNLITKSKRDIVTKAMDLNWLDKIIMHEEKGFLVINKPSGLAVHGGSGISLGLIELLREHRKSKYETLELIHRIDKETSGIILIAKKRSSLRSIHQFFRDGLVKKTYHALLIGLTKQETFIVNQPLKVDRANGQRKSVIHPEGAKAKTNFKLINSFNDSSLFQISPVTGRTHQIRVHMDAINHCIVGDQVYQGGKKSNLDLHEVLGEEYESFRRQALHAEKLSFQHPVSKKNLEFKASPPKDFQKLLKLLPQHQDRPLYT